MNTDFPRSPSCPRSPRSCNTANSRALAATLLLSLAALVACRSPLLIVTPIVTPIVAPAAAEGIATAATLPAPQLPFDTTPITPVETAGASVE